jgi:hypothetical protein
MICPKCGKILKANLKIEVCSKCLYTQPNCQGCFEVKFPPLCPDCGCFSQGKITLWVHLPETVTAVYIAGNFNNWNPGKTRLKYDPDINVWAITLFSSGEGIIEYKYTQGTWETVETTNNFVDIPNRRIEVKYGSGFSGGFSAKSLIHDRVEEWKMDKDVSDLLFNLRSPDQKVRIGALNFFRSNSFNKKKTKHALPFIYKMLFDSDEKVRVEAAISIARVTKDDEQIQTREVEPFIQALKDKDENVRSDAALALRKIGDARAVEPLIQALKDFHVHFDAAKALVKIGKPAVEALIQALNCEDVDVQQHAVTALGEIGDVRAVEPLVQVLKGGDIRVHRSALMALGNIGEKRSSGEVIEYLFRNPGEHWNLKRLFGDYAEIISQASSCFSTTDVSPNPYRSEYANHLEMAPIVKLCNINSPISSNILHLVKKMQDIRLEISYSCGSSSYGELFLGPIRELARKELERRGNPPYDPSVYLNEEAWKL